MIGRFRVNQKAILNSHRLLDANDNKLLYSTKSKDEISSDIFDAVDGEISAEVLTERLFPNKEPHIFISHSSKDAPVAIRFANTLYSKYGIISFIDSQLWLHIDYALKQMHEKYCKSLISDGYNYTKSNILLAHMHSILSMALMRAMDESDSVIFIESENSIYQYMEGKQIKPHDKIVNKYETLSPWISSEVNFANKLRIKGHKDRGLEKVGTESYSINEDRKIVADSMPSIIHQLDFKDFIEITEASLKKALTLSTKSPINDLDRMYQAFIQG
ncbi:hypothetical protein NGJ69_20695 [Atlantibacter hermannii]|uniref:hypothetical protein n=1 Tax=Atlantibacter hermannii TaxID=565 RepID=UPI002DBF591F|nr:hypothetical protein [Atlantibacter hermannii]MEB7926098.1 hypothetical protein [Atlantibacter hermannii]